MADLVIKSLRGGLNNSDPPNSIPDDQVVVAENVEFYKSLLGERRDGCTAVDTAGSGLAGRDRGSFIFRHLPSTDEADAELWALGVSGTLSSALCRKTNSWSTVTPVDTIDVTGTYQYQLRAASLHGKMFLAYKSTEDRAHVWDGTSLRRAGLAEPAAPSVVDSVGAGTFTGTRYYRVRYTTQVASETILRSEPSETTTFVPTGTNLGAHIVKPASIGEDETHWEIEASVDNTNFYVITTLDVSTLTYDDATAFSPGYADLYDLAPDIGDYTLIPSARIFVVDDDRLVWMGSFEDESLSSRVGWTPVNKAEGVGNDERMEADTDPFIDLDGLEGGPITDGISGVQGYIYVFKFSHIYQLVRTGQRSRAYQAYNITKQRGAIEGSVVTGLDEAGRPVVFFLDPAVGPCTLGRNDVRWCGPDVRATWESINLDASKVVARGVYYPKKHQVIWAIATNDSDTPNLMMVLQTNEMRPADLGDRRGWTLWTGSIANALSMCLFSSNIDDDTDRSRDLVPFIAVEDDGLIWRFDDTAIDDNGVPFAATIDTKPITTVGMLNQFEVKSASILTKATTGAALDVSALRDFGAEVKTVEGVSCTPAGDETQVITPLSDLHFSELRTVQFRFADVDSPEAKWEVNEFSFRHERGNRP